MVSRQFSIVIPTYNRLGLLKAALDSVWQQTMLPAEVIVVDDGSSDGTFDWLSAEPRVRALRQPNQGPGVARNLGAAHANAEYLVFLDSDDLLYPSALQVYAEALDRHPRARIVLASCEHFSGSLPPISPPQVDITTRFFDSCLDAAVRAHRHVVGGSFAVHRDVFLMIRGFDPELRCAEDQDWGLRVGDQVPCVCVETPPQVGYRLHQSSATRDLRQIHAGTAAVVRRERRGEYPGGAARRRERRAAILNMAIPVSIDSLRGQAVDAWRLYLSLLNWSVAAGRFKYLFGFPVLAIRRVLVGPASE